MPTCYYCHKDGHVVYQCPNVPPCTNCGKKGHRVTQCADSPKPAPKIASKPAPKIASKPVPKIASKPVPKINLFEFLGDVSDSETDSETISWADEMENDFAFMNAKMLNAY